MRRRQYNHRQLRRKKKHKFRDNKNQVPHRLPWYNRKRIQKIMREWRKKNE